MLVIMGCKLTVRLRTHTPTHMRAIVERQKIGNPDRPRVAYL